MSDLTTDQIQAAREVLSAMPDQEWRDGGRVDWGPEGNKARALYLAAVAGHVYDPDCLSCESDLWLKLKELVK